MDFITVWEIQMNISRSFLEVSSILARLKISCGAVMGAGHRVRRTGFKIHKKNTPIL
jgi:hypothetical protein